MYAGQQARCTGTNPIATATKNTSYLRSVGRWHSPLQSILKSPTFNPMSYASDMLEQEGFSEVPIPADPSYYPAIERPLAA